MPHSMMGIVLMAVGVLVVLCVLAFIIGSLGGVPGGADDMETQRRESRRWATPRDLKELECVEPDARRLRLCEMGKLKLALPKYRSMVVLAPSGSGKTPRVVVPILLRHRGPALVTSVKSDVLLLTRKAREDDGPVWVFDPCQAAGPTVQWSPLTRIATWADALDAARWIQDSQTAEGASGVEGMQYWNAQARFLLAPLLFLTAKKGGTMPTVFHLLDDSREKQERITHDLEELGEPDAELCWKQYLQMDARPRSSVLATARTVLEAWTHPRVREAVAVKAGQGIDLDLDFISQGKGTLYLIAPASDQQMFTPIFETLINSVLMLMERQAMKAGLPPERPLLLMLDEAANIAPLRDLPGVLSKGANEGVVTCHVWQDEGQMVTTYGEAKTRTILNNSFAKIYMPGITDNRTLENLSDLIGSDKFRQRSYQRSVEQRTSTTDSTFMAEVAPVEWLRELSASTVICVVSRFRPIWAKLPAWYEDDEYRRLVDPDVAARFDALFASPSTGKRRGRKSLR